jgi:hypothetical protein
MSEILCFQKHLPSNYSNSDSTVQVRPIYYLILITSLHHPFDFFTKNLTMSGHDFVPFQLIKITKTLLKSHHATLKAFTYCTQLLKFLLTVTIKSFYRSLSWLLVFWQYTSCLLSMNLQTTNLPIYLLTNQTCNQS